MRAVPLYLFLLLAGIPCALSAGEAPKPKPEIKSVEPYWVPNGKPATLKIVGNDLSPKGVEFTEKKIASKVVKAEKLDPKTDEEKAKGNSVVELEVTAPAGLKPGSYPFKLLHDGDEKPESRVYIDDEYPQLEEKEPNNTLRKPEVLPPAPVAVTGKLDNEGVDVFQIDGKAGETYHIEILAARAGSPFEPVLRLRDPRKVSVKVAVDEGNDCAMDYKLPTDGPYLLELFDGDNRTEGKFFYRLMVKRVSASPPADK
jgi:hypothetical protein